MAVWSALLLGTAGYPFWRLWQANRQTSLSHTIVRATAAWVVWCAAPLIPDKWTPPTVYGALCLTGCAGIAVLGARRPGVAAWNFVVVGLLAVLLLQLLEGLDRLGDSPLRLLFIAATLAISLLNYLPTRLGLAAVCIAAGCSLELLGLVGWQSGIPRETIPPLAQLLLALGVWLGLLLMRTRSKALNEFDKTWLNFRDRWGVVWGQRLREQWNRAAHNAGWSVTLEWHGLSDATISLAEALTLLQSLCKRFGVG